jgi:glycerol-3-phosphate acyltransferase PlsY
LAITVMIFIRHRGNMSRLAKGTEPKVGKKT